MSKICIAHLRSISAYTFSRKYSVPKMEKETAADYEARTWRERCHVNADGFVVLPPMGFKFSLDGAAAMLRERIKEKGTSEWGKVFKSGILVTEGLALPVRKDEIDGLWLPMNADGRRGSGKRVDRCMPTVPSWEGEVTYYLLNSAIQEDVFERHLREAGNFIGIGQFRPQNGGYNGRYEVVKLKFQTMR